MLAGLRAALRLWPLWLAAVAAAGGWQARGWREGAEAAAELRLALDARIAADKRAAAADAALGVAEVARLTEQRRADDLARELEDAANADTISGGGLPRARVERLQRR